jgi:glycosyltransferase involved in cell wall biosynthesis
VKFICFYHRPYGHGYELKRELGALYLGLQQIGEDVRFFMMDSGVPSNNPAIEVVASEQAVDPEWWKNTGADYVVMLFGGRPLEKYYRAIKASGLKLLYRMDTDGWISPSLSFRRFADGKVIYAIDHDGSHRGFTRVLFAFLHGYLTAFLRWLCARKLDAELAARLALGDHILVESPLALDRLKNFTERAGNDPLAGKLIHLPIAVNVPVPQESFIAKENLVLSVGVWWRFQKDTSLMIRSLCSFLENQPQYRAIIVGPGEEEVKRHLRRFGGKNLDRIDVVGSVPHEQVHKYYALAKIHFLASRSEGFPNVCAEAACHGCSNVGWEGIAAFQYFAASDCGSVATRRTLGDFVHALKSEVRAWDSGQRDLNSISEWACNLFSTAAVAKRLVHTLHIYNGL